MDELTEIAEVCERAARRGGAVLLDWSQRFTIREKGPADLVTEADLAAEEAVRETIAQAFPDHRFVGEETTPAAKVQSVLNETAGCVWIVDPLDGTTNYAHHVPHYACSVAAVRDGTVLAGAIYHPTAEECYFAVRQRGAFLNGETIAVSRTQSLDAALVAASFPPRIDRNGPEVQKLLAVIERAQAIRRTGSAALNMCYVASGRLDAYWATGTSAWDIAAGVLLVTEAGGTVTDLSGGPFTLMRPQPIAAGTVELNRELAAILGL